MTAKGAVQFSINSKPARGRVNPRGRPRIIGVKTLRGNSSFQTGKGRSQSSLNEPTSLSLPLASNCRRPSARIAYQRSQKSKNSRTDSNTESFMTRLKTSRAVQPWTPLKDKKEQAFNEFQSSCNGANIQKSIELEKSPLIRQLTTDEQNPSSTHQILTKPRNPVKITDVPDDEETYQYASHMVSSRETSPKEPGIVGYNVQQLALKHAISELNDQITTVMLLLLLGIF